MGSAYYRCSCPEVFCKKDVLINFAKFTGKHLCRSLFFNKVAGLTPATLFKKRLWHRGFPVNFAKFLRTPILKELLWLLLLLLMVNSGKYHSCCLSFSHSLLFLVYFICMYAYIMLMFLNLSNISNESINL